VFLGSCGHIHPPLLLALVFFLFYPLLVNRYSKFTFSHSVYFYVSVKERDADAYFSRKYENYFLFIQRPGVREGEVRIFIVILLLVVAELYTSHL
jgi:hypothetical protein